MGWFKFNSFHPDVTTIYQHKNTCERGAGHALGVEPGSDELRWVAIIVALVPIVHVVGQIIIIIILIKSLLKSGILCH